MSKNTVTASTFVFFLHENLVRCDYYTILYFFCLIQFVLPFRIFDVFKDAIPTSPSCDVANGGGRKGTDEGIDLWNSPSRDSCWSGRQVFLSSHTHVAVLDI